jgi:RNA-directed DNA polymerase
VAGIVVNQHLNMERAEFDRLRAQLHQCGLHGPAAHNPLGHADLRAHLLGRIAWATQLNPTREPRLRRLWDAIDWR